MEILFFYLIEDSASVLSNLSLVWWFLGVLVTAALAVLGLMAKNRKEIYSTQKEVSAANKQLVNTRDVELADCREDLEETKKNCERVSSEYKTVVGLKIEELLKFWERKEEREAHWENVEAENRRLKRRLEGKSD
jgi:cell division protein FtsL